MSSKELVAADAGSLLESLDYFIFDCDGCLWNENGEPFPNAVETLNKLQLLGKKIYYITNNSSKTRKEYAEKIKACGFPATEDNVISSAWLAAYYLKNIVDFKDKVYLVGGPALQTELSNAGISFICQREEFYANYTEYISHCELDPEVKAVVVGFDPYINYMKCIKASSYLQREGCLFVVTNTDSFLPTNGELRIPGTGSIASFIQCPAERTPTIVGKPEKLAREILQSLDPNFNSHRTMMVGDRLDTDMLFGNTCGFKSLLVLTGAGSVSDIQKYSSSNSIEDQKKIPNFYLSDIGKLGDYIK